MPDSKETQGNYSLYPASPVPPGNQIPPGAAAAAAANSYLYSNPYHSQYNYAYPMGIELYPSQTLQYVGYHQPAMAYGGYGGPAQGAVPMKKKFYNGGNNYKKDNQSNNIGGSNSVGGTGAHNGTTTSPDNSKPVQVTIKNLFKFELGNSNCVHVDGLKVEYPMFVNTNAEEYAMAKSKRNAMRMEALRDMHTSENKKTSESNTATASLEPSTLENTSQRPTEEEDITPIVGKDSSDNKPSTKEHKSPNFNKDTEGSPVATKASQSKDEQQTMVKRKDDSSAKVSEKKPEVPVKPIKSWSQIASSAMNKSKSPAALPATQSRKDRKYIPSSTKSSESVGAVSLRISLDKDYTNFINENANESSRAINSIVPRGILNKGNICFMSSVLQVLLFCKPFIKMLNVVHMRTSHKAGENLPPLLEACIEFFKGFDKNAFEKEKSEKQASLGNGNKSLKNAAQVSLSESVDPEPFYKSISKLALFRDLQWGHQEDAEEFLTHFLDQLHEEFVSTINSLSSSEVLSLLQSIPDEDLRVEFIKSLTKYKRSEFMKNISPELKSLIEKQGNGLDDDLDNSDSNAEWHEVSKKGKKTKNAVKRTMEVEPSPIMSIFGGEYRSVLDIPQNKESQSITLDPFYTLHLHISDPEVNDLVSAYRKFSDFEYLPYKADSGNDVQAKKQAFIDRLPSVLLIQLKRFEFVNHDSESRELANYNAYNGRIEKIRKWIKYGHELTIPREAISSVSAKFYSSDKDTKYKLTGVVYHHGLSSSGGHYTADVLHQDQDKWYRIDDVNVTEIKKEDVVKGGDADSDSKTAYILLYQKE
ncbi:HGL116Cp [Eremothecium sinecaudum]|uniref:Ubiquitin carboxyl-terminal hydrolase n=1 Tax=Eremothecium sinecaudum TaxID=45286 RepID=A0A0X8HVK3_9SACH|nr:HGL116Cp [Eremothecium sinecaudum]AMD22224.1 HGL116Cp [Eremothecium sinecaudum]